MPGWIDTLEGEDYYTLIKGAAKTREIIARIKKEDPMSFDQGGCCTNSEGLETRHFYSVPQWELVSGVTPVLCISDEIGVRVHRAHRCPYCRHVWWW